MSKKFCVLITTFNGENFLFEQISSLANQTEQNVSVLLSDHGSRDRTLQIAEAARRNWEKGEFHILTDADDTVPQGSSAVSRAAYNFHHLLKTVDLGHDYYALCDQDDIWDPDKLSTARSWLESQPFDVPALYCTRTRLVNRDGKMIGTSPIFQKPPHFRNAIVQNIAGGNTMVMNETAVKLLKKTIPKNPTVIHDWWAYIVVSGVGGSVYYSHDPKISYRQHSSNLVGENVSAGAMWRRLRMVLAGRFKQWNDMNRAAIGEIEAELSGDARATLKMFDEIRSTGGLKALRLLKRSGIYRQTSFGQLSLYIACALKKM